MPRWYVEPETKKKLDLFRSNLETLLQRPSMSQDELLRLILKHEGKILDVIVAEESATTNNKPLQGSVPA